MLSPLYLDYLGTTPLSPEAASAMEAFILKKAGNPSSGHSAGLLARDMIKKARSGVARLVNAGPDEEILFTSGATESANLAVKGVAWAAEESGKKHLVLSEIEHPSVEEAVRFLEAKGFTATRVPVDSQGRISPESIRQALTAETCLVALHHANYDVGTLQPLADISDICRSSRVPLFCDASISAGWLPLDVQALGVDLLSLAPHRFYGPRGTGVLYRRKGVSLTPLIHGGRQEFQLRAGTENMEGIVGAGAAALLAMQVLVDRKEKCRVLQKLFLDGLEKAVPQWRLNGPPPGPDRDPHHLSISFLHVEAEALALRLDLRGIQVGAGTGCRSRELKLSPVLKALNVPKEWALGTLLIGLSEKLTEEDIGRAVKEIADAVGKLREMSAGWKSGQQM